MIARFNIADPSGRLIYTNLIRTPNGYDWGDGYGSISDTQIAVERWSVIPIHQPVRDPSSFTADGWRLMSPDTQRSLGEMVKHVLARQP